MMKMKMSIYFIVNSAQVLWDMSSQCTGPGWFKSCGIGLRHLAGMRHYTFSSWQFRSWWRVLCINVCVRVYRVVDFNNMKLSKAWHCSGSISSQAHSFWRGSSSWFVSGMLASLSVGTVCGLHSLAQSSFWAGFVCSTPIYLLASTCA